MSKQKTRKTISKRFKIKKRTGKIIKRTCGQDHFNSRERGKTTRSKRKDRRVAKSEYKVIRGSM